MKNEVLNNRFEGILDILMGAFKAGKKGSNVTKGFEREIFINQFLRSIFPPQFRFGSGEIIDINGNLSGQVDIVIEYPFLPSFPLSGLESPRLYFAEGVAAVIEVKSNLRHQKAQIIKKAKQINNVKRQRYSIQEANYITESLQKIPFYVVGFEGWSKIDYLVKYQTSNPINGILQINKKWFFSYVQKDPRNFSDWFERNTVCTDDNDCLMGLLHCLTEDLFITGKHMMTPRSYCDEMMQQTDLDHLKRLIKELQSKQENT
ncbi:hypothetical protein J7L05_00405 [bacterium]|nr:hypothetical protein [bacterium]